MKKFLFGCIVIVLLLIPTLAFADMSAPGFILYSAYVSNPGGAPYYKTTDLEEEAAGTLPFKTKIICYSNYDDYRLAFVLENEDFSYENNSTKYIDKYNVTIDDLTRYSLGDSQEVRTFSNAIIYDMPTDATEGKVLGMIPEETDITVQRYLVNEEETGLWNEWTKWYYTTYNNINGWINLKDFAFYEDDGDFVTARNLISKEGLFVPMYTPVKEYYGFGGEQFYKAAFYYEGEVVEADIEEDFANVVTNENMDNYTYEILFDGISLYEQANTKSKIVVDSLPVGITVSPEYVVFGHAFETWMCVRYEDERAWMYIGDLYSFKDKAEAEKEFENNKRVLEEGKANGWDWYTESNYPTSYESLKTYYDEHIKDGMEYSDDAIEKSDAKRLTPEKKEERVEIISGEDIDLKPSDAKPSSGSLGTNEMVVAIVAILAFVVVVVATLVTVVVLIVKKRK